MKLAIIILAVLGLACGKPVPSGSLQHDLKELLEKLPTGKVFEIVMDYLYYDKEVKEFIVNIQSEEFPKIHTYVEKLKEYENCFKFFDEHGVDVYAIIKQVYDTVGHTLGYPPFEPKGTSRNGVGFRGLIEDVISVLPLDGLKALYEKEEEIKECVRTLYKAIQSPLFRKMVDTMQDWPDYQKMVETLQEWPEYQEILDYLRGKGVDVDRYVELVRTLHSLSRRGIRILYEDVTEFMELVPPYKFYQIAMDYLAYDPQVREFVFYIQSEKFPPIHRIVEYLKGYKDCLKYIDDRGVDVYAIVKKIYDTLPFPPFEPTNTTHTGVGFHGLIDDMIAAFPLDGLKAFIEKKMETREYLKPLFPAYKALVKTIQSPEFREMVKNVQETVRTKMVDCVRTMMVDFVQNWPEYKRQLEMLRKKFYDKDRIMEILEELREPFWRVTNILRDDMREFMTLVPTEKVLVITLEYLAYDPELQERLVYIQSEKFPMVNATVEYLKQYKHCLKFIDDRGVNVYTIVKKIHDTLGYPPFEPRNTTRMGVGIQGLKCDVIAAFPLNEFKALVEKKMETRPYFKPLVTSYKTVVKTIQSPEFWKMVETVRAYMVDTVRSWPEYQKVVQMLREKVFDEDHIIELARELRKLFLRGFYILKEDLTELMPLVPTDKILDITLDYLAYDPELQEFLDYIQSEKFPPIHKIVEYLKQYQDCLKYIDDRGVDVYAIIKKIHDTLGYPPFEPTNTTRTGVGFHGLFHDVIAAFPRDDLKAFVEKKMETREYFKILVTAYKTLLTTIRSPEFKEMVESVQAFMSDTVQAFAEQQKLLEYLREMGVDVDRIIEFIRILCSWHPVY